MTLIKHCIGDALTRALLFNSICLSRLSNDFFRGAKDCRHILVCQLSEEPKIVVIYLSVNYQRIQRLSSYTCLSIIIDIMDDVLDYQFQNFGQPFYLDFDYHM